MNGDRYVGFTVKGAVGGDRIAVSEWEGQSE